MGNKQDSLYRVASTKVCQPKWRKTFWHEVADIFAETEQLSDRGRGDVRHGRFIEEQDGLDASQMSVDIGQSSFILEIHHGTNASQYVSAI